MKKIPPLSPVQALPVLFVFGALAGTLGDAGHVFSQTLGYPESSWPVIPATGQPLWVPLLMGSAGVSMGLGQWIVLQTLGRWFPSWVQAPSRGVSPLSLLGWTTLLLGVWFLSGYLPWPTGAGRDLALAGIALAVWGLAERTWIGLVLAGATAVLGTLVELTLVASGKFSYLPEHSNLRWGFAGGVPSWLPWLYVVANVCAWRVASELITSRDSRQAK